MKNPEKSGKNDLRKSIPKKVGKRTRPGRELYVAVSPGETTIQEDILRIGYILGKKLIERIHYEEKKQRGANLGGENRRKNKKGELRGGKIS